MGGVFSNLKFQQGKYPAVLINKQFAPQIYVGCHILGIVSCYYSSLCFLLTFRQYFRDYFPITLEKSCDLDPKKNYIFGYHPHGIMSVAMFTNFGTDVTGFPKIFPGITVHPITLVGQFWFPFRREIIIHSGMCQLSKRLLIKD